LLLYSTSVYSHCRYVATGTVVLYRALAIFTVNISSQVRYGNPRENKVKNKSVPSTSAGRCRRWYNADHLKKSGQRSSVSFLPQLSRSLLFLNYPVDNERVRQSMLLVQPVRLATLATRLAKTYCITPQSAGNCLN